MLKVLTYYCKESIIFVFHKVTCNSTLFSITYFTMQNMTFTYFILYIYSFIFVKYPDFLIITNLKKEKNLIVIEIYSFLVL